VKVKTIDSANDFQTWSKLMLIIQRLAVTYDLPAEVVDDDTAAVVLGL
jgi:hypothetical protein